MTAIDQKTIQFCQEHRINIIDINKRAFIYNKINVNYFQNPIDYNHMTSMQVIDTEPLYTIEIAKSELEKLAEFESQVFNNMKQHNHYSMFLILMEQKEKEKKLKEKFPAVKKAYENYSLLLKLAESDEL